MNNELQEKPSGTNTLPVDRTKITLNVFKNRTSEYSGSRRNNESLSGASSSHFIQIKHNHMMQSLGLEDSEIRQQTSHPESNNLDNARSIHSNQSNDISATKKKNYGNKLKQSTMKSKYEDEAPVQQQSTSNKKQPSKKFIKTSSFPKTVGEPHIFDKHLIGICADALKLNSYLQRKQEHQKVFGSVDSQDLSKLSFPTFESGEKPTNRIFANCSSSLPPNGKFSDSSENGDDKGTKKSPVKKQETVEKMPITINAKENLTVTHDLTMRSLRNDKEQSTDRHLMEENARDVIQPPQIVIQTLGKSSVRPSNMQQSVEDVQEQKEDGNSLIIQLQKTIQKENQKSNKMLRNSYNFKKETANNNNDDDNENLLLNFKKRDDGTFQPVEIIQKQRSGTQKHSRLRLQSFKKNPIKYEKEESTPKVINESKFSSSNSSSRYTNSKKPGQPLARSQSQVKDQFQSQDENLERMFLDPRKIQKTKSVYVKKAEKIPTFSNILDPRLDDQKSHKLQKMLVDYKKREKTRRSKAKGKDSHTLDHYIMVLSCLHQTQRFQQIFEQQNLNLSFIQPTMTPSDLQLEHKIFKNFDSDHSVKVAAIFLHGCYLFRQQDFAMAARSFKRLLQLRGDKRLVEQASSIEYEATFNLGTCQLKMGDSKSALKLFASLLHEQKRENDNHKSHQQKRQNQHNQDDKRDKLTKIKSHQANRFEGRDRRLYLNKALCEIHLGFCDQAIATCKSYLKPLNRVMEKLIHAKEIFRQAQKKADLAAHNRSKKTKKTIIKNMDLQEISEAGSNDSRYDKNVQSNQDTSKDKDKDADDISAYRSVIASSADSINVFSASSEGSINSVAAGNSKQAVKKLKAKLNRLTQFNKLQQPEKRLCLDLNKIMVSVSSNDGNSAVENINDLDDTNNLYDEMEQVLFSKQESKNISQKLDLHPKYGKGSDLDIVREFYRLKGIALLRNRQKNLNIQQVGSNKILDDEDADNEFDLVKAASCFQRAIGKADSQLLERYHNRLNRILQKQKQGCQTTTNQVKSRKDAAKEEKNRLLLFNLKRMLEGTLFIDRPNEQNQDNSAAHNLGGDENEGGFSSAVLIRRSRKLKSNEFGNLEQNLPAASPLFNSIQQASPMQQFSSLQHTKTLRKIGDDDMTRKSIPNFQRELTTNNNLNQDRNLKKSFTLKRQLPTQMNRYNSQAIPYARQKSLRLQELQVIQKLDLNDMYGDLERLYVQNINKEMTKVLSRQTQENKNEQKDNSAQGEKSQGLKRISSQQKVSGQKVSSNLGSHLVSPHNNSQQKQHSLKQQNPSNPIIIQDTQHTQQDEENEWKLSRKNSAWSACSRQSRAFNNIDEMINPQKQQREGSEMMNNSRFSNVSQKHAQSDKDSFSISSKKSTRQPKINSPLESDSKRKKQSIFKQISAKKTSENKNNNIDRESSHPNSVPQQRIRPIVNSTSIPISNININVLGITSKESVQNKNLIPDSFAQVVAVSKTLHNIKPSQTQNFKINHPQSSFQKTARNMSTKEGQKKTIHFNFQSSQGQDSTIQSEDIISDRKNLKPKKQLTWLQGHQKFIKDFAKEGRKIKREIFAKKRLFQSVVLLTNSKPKNQDNEKSTYADYNQKKKTNYEFNTKSQTFIMNLPQLMGKQTKFLIEQKTTKLINTNIVQVLGPKKQDLMLQNPYQTSTGGFIINNDNTDEYMSQINLKTSQSGLAQSQSQFNFQSSKYLSRMQGTALTQARMHKTLQKIRQSQETEEDELSKMRVSMNPTRSCSKEPKRGLLQVQSVRTSINHQNLLLKPIQKALTPGMAKERISTRQLSQQYRTMHQQQSRNQNHPQLNPSTQFKQLLGGKFSKWTSY